VYFFVMTGVSVLLVPDVQRSGPPAVVEKAGQERQEVGRWKKEKHKNAAKQL